MLRIRISRGQTVSYNPAIIDVTFTQLGPFQALLHDQEANNRGLIARMLVYRHLPDEIVYRHERYPLSDGDTATHGKRFIPNHWGTRCRA